MKQPSRSWNRRKQNSPRRIHPGSVALVKPEFRSWYGWRAAPSPSPSAASGDGTNVAARQSLHDLFRPLRAGGDSAARCPYRVLECPTSEFGFNVFSGRSVLLTDAVRKAEPVVLAKRGVGRDFLFRSRRDALSCVISGRALPFSGKKSVPIRVIRGRNSHGLSDS